MSRYQHEVPSSCCPTVYLSVMHTSTVTPPLFGAQGRLILDISIAPYSIYRFLYFFFLLYCTDKPADGDNPGGIATTSNGIQHQKLQLALILSHSLIRGLSRNNICRSYSSQYRNFPSFYFLFCLDKGDNHLLSDNLPGRRMPAPSASASTTRSPTPTQDHHQDTQPGWQGLRTVTGPPGSGTQSFEYHGDNPDGGVLQ